MKKKKLKIWGLSNQDTAVQLYRINQPLRFIANQKLATIHTMPFFGQHSDHLTSKEFIEYYALEGKWAEAVFSTCATNQEYLALLLALKDRYKLKLVIDLDDDILSTHLEPNNPAYQAYMQESTRFAEYAQACLREADLVTVSTDYLKKKYQSINSNIVVVKNVIDPAFFSFKRKKNKKITIGYSGSGSHQLDWMMIEPILERLKKKYDLRIAMLGPMQTKIVDDQTNWVDTLKYPEQLAAKGFDIGVAPLRDSMMSRAKSNLRWLEYSSYKIPTVSSDVVAFRGVRNIIRVNEPEEWYIELEKLILDKKYRTSLGDAAYNEVNADYRPDLQSQRLFRAITELFSR